MNGNELIALLSNSLPVINSCVGTITGALIAAFFLRRNTEVQEFEKLKAGKFSEVVNDLLDSGKMTYTEFYKASNFLKIAELADEQLRDNKNSNNDKKTNLYEFDWFARFYEVAGNISDEMMQIYWSKLLAGELQNPSTFSLQTIDILKNLRKNDVDLFAKVCLHSILHRHTTFLPNYRDFLDDNGINYQDILLLDEYGLLNSNSTLIYRENVNPDSESWFYGTDTVLTFKNNTSKVGEIKINVFPFTNAGHQLSLINNCFANKKDLIVISKKLKNQKFALKIYP